jgi:hypothetical protein
LNIDVFQADANPCKETNTNPLEWDTDNDGLPDGWIDGWDPITGTIVELEKNGQKDPGEGEDLNCDGAITGDKNNDGIFDWVDPLKEQTADSEGNKPKTEPWEETSPHFPDSDHDGLFDGMDMDYDNDGFIELDGGDLGKEYFGELSIHYLDPANLYTKYDELSPLDGLIQQEPTNPLNPDSDGDMLWDGMDVDLDGDMYYGELSSTNLYESKMNGHNGDILNDGVIDYKCRWQNDNDDRFILPDQVYLTDPTIYDCDGDEVADGVEIIGWEVIITNGKTLEVEERGRWVYSNPRVVDTDGDNKNEDFATTDCDESMYKSDPSNIDTDRDYLRDWEEDELTIKEIEGEDPEMGEIECRNTWV